MKDFKLKDGMKVLIKSWKKMKKEYGLDTDGDINLSPHFSKEMKHLCKKVVTIEIDNNIATTTSKRKIWFICPQMVEAVICPESYEEHEQEEEHKKFIYPIFKKSKVTNVIVKFIGPNEATVLFDPNNQHNNDSGYDWVEHTDTDSWEDVPYDKERGFWHGQPVWFWGNNDTHVRQVRFYNVKNQATFSYTGYTHGVGFGNYEAVKPEHYEDWMYEAYKTLEGI